jgi:hypothetical protein
MKTAQRFASPTRRCWESNLAGKAFSPDPHPGGSAAPAESGASGVGQYFLEQQSTCTFFPIMIYGKSPGFGLGLRMK